MGLFTKICGLSEPVGLQTALDHGADMVGFVFFQASPRNVGAEAAAQLLQQVPSGVDRVGVFVDPENDYLDTVLGKARLDLLQLHGDETPERCRAIAIYFGLPLIKAIKVSSPADIEKAREYEDIVDWLMFDASPPKDATRPGGHGLSFDWTMLKGQSFKRPWLLSGGLHAGNLAEAANKSGANAVDVSSGVESAPGRKDPEKIRAFLAAARDI
ncbi:phosphoribosylanthranilate isomerase [Ferrovibrio sp.]|uniref:phosphoribosylanthranilate isomerase n=1 Tax=Ferrovibrio sp. TaxID=1917215 RepID=UPI0025BBB44B|nr:phosphoribosylanthranilate isomerase [Ferrovibrio sp.]MBX3455742.1 phosphoribosylanthranilate isomerase [Ferrovibrio sp.]